MKLRYIIGAFLLGLGLTLSCEREQPMTLSEIQVPQSIVSIDVAGGITQLQFTAQSDWSIDEASLGEWLTATPMSGGAGEAAVTFSAEATTSTRTAEVHINCGTKTQYITVIQFAQKAEPVILTVSEALAKIKAVDKGDGNSYYVDGEYYVNGIVCRIDEISTQYGNATFYLSENGKFEEGKWLEVYRAKWLENKAFSTGNEFSVGDEITIVGKLMSYKGNTPETVQGEAHVYKHSKSLISVNDFSFEKLPAIDTTFHMVVTASESPLLVTSDSPWLQLMSVTEDGAYVLHADENTKTAERTATISIQGPTALKSVSITQRGIPATGSSVSDIVAMSDDSQVQTLPSTVVVALTTKGAVLSDGVKAIYAYGEAAAALSVGDGVSMSAKKITYGGVPELTDITAVDVDSQNNPFQAPAAEDITDRAGEYAATEAEYIKLSGTLTVSGNYYNLTLDAFADGSKQGSIAAPVEALNASSYAGRKITVTGWFNGLGSNGKYINIIATKIEEYADNPKGTETNPFTASEARAWVLENLASGEVSSESYFVKGIISKFAVSREVEQTFTNCASFGNASFYITDDGTDSDNWFEAYQVYYLGNRKWVEGDPDVKPGDEVVICGPLTLYTPSSGEPVPETTGKGTAYIYSLNAGGGDEPGGDEPGGDDPIELGPFDSNVLVFTTGASCYTDNVVNVTYGEQVYENVANMKFGTSKKFGEGYLTIPGGTRKISFYAVGWNGASATLKISICLSWTEGQTPSEMTYREFASKKVQENSGASGSAPYSIVVTDDDRYEIEFSQAVGGTVNEAGTYLKVETVDGEEGYKGYRAFVFGIQCTAE